MLLVVCVCLFVCLFVCPSVDRIITNNTWICKILLQEVCLGPRNNPSHFVDDPDYNPDPDHDPDPEFKMFLGPRNNPINIGDDPDYDQDPNSIHNHFAQVYSVRQ